MPRYDRIKNILANINEYILIFGAILTSVGALIYYLYALNRWGAALALVISILLFWLFAAKYHFPKKERGAENRSNMLVWKKYWPYVLAFFLATGWAFFLLYSGRSDRAIISPWLLVPSIFFLAYLLAALSLLLITRKKEIGDGVKIGFLSLFYFLSFSVALIIYRLGYGFDPFVHQATMELIAQKGWVDPKPLYYLGQYSLVVITHLFSGWPIGGLNKILVSLLAAFFLPLAGYRFLRRADEEDQNHSSWSEFATILFLLVLGFSPFIVTTPQNLAYLFLLLSVLAGLGKAKPIFVLILAIATTAVHPLCGLPSLAWSGWLFLHRYQRHLLSIWRRISKTAVFLISSLVLPLGLWLSSGRTFSFSLAKLLAPLEETFSRLGSAGQEDWLLNLVYFLADNRSLLLALVLAASIIYFYSSRKKEAKRAWRENGLLFIIASLGVAYFLVSQIHFSGLISYEQNDYAQRLLVVILIFSLPFFMEILNRLIKRIGGVDRTSQIIWLIIGLFFLASSLYLSYPRYDRYFNSRGYNTSANDLEAVKLIAQETKEPYIVLANQQVSAGALKEFGFDHYYQSAQGPLYFYPIPTGGALYDYYLKMVYDSPERDTINQALGLAGVRTGYLVVNKYWYQSDRVIARAKLTADSWHDVRGEVYIFKYSK